MHSFAVHDLTQEKKKLPESYEKLVEDVNGLLDAQERRAEVEGKIMKPTSFRRSMTWLRT